MKYESQSLSKAVVTFVYHNWWIAALLLTGYIIGLKV